MYHSFLPIYTNRTFYLAIKQRTGIFKIKHETKSHFSALYYSHILIRFFPGCTSIFNHSYNFHPINNLAKDNVFIIQKGGWCCSYEELTAICIWAGILKPISIYPLRREKKKKKRMSLQPCSINQHDHALW